MKRMTIPFRLYLLLQILLCGTDSCVFYWYHQPAICSFLFVTADQQITSLETLCADSHIKRVAWVGDRVKGMDAYLMFLKRKRSGKVLGRGCELVEKQIETALSNFQAWKRNVQFFTRNCWAANYKSGNAACRFQSRQHIKSVAIATARWQISTAVSN